MSKLNIPEKDFLAFAMHERKRRGYKSAWQWVLFKENYGVWVDKSVRFTDGVEVEPKEPTDEFLDWVYEYQSQWVSKEKVCETHQSGESN